ncbi:hypothetical protein BKA56DRAFT_677490 [Ilyonectria sp. MPI-CAGE-AT-0026]|nr:hypothetical protein BKA56DRAFT_677490 [Ilyonectria sp. MPI-CAGE-AT-0026]
MAPHNLQGETQIEDYRRKRRLLVARNIDFKATRATFEADVRAKLTKPGSVIFLWPPPSSAQYSNPNRHRGWVMLGFNQRPDARTAEVDLKDYVFRNRPIRIDRAMRHTPGSSRARTAASATTTSVTATPAIAPAIAASTTTALTTGTTATPPTALATAARNLPAQPTPAYGTATNSSPDSLEGALLMSWESLPSKRHDDPEDEDENQSNRDNDDEVFWDD